MILSNFEVFAEIFKHYMERQKIAPLERGGCNNPLLVKYLTFLFSKIDHNFNKVYNYF